MKDIFRKYKVVAWCLTGLLLGVPFVDFFWWPLGIIGIACTIHIIFSVGSVKEAVKAGLCIGFIKYLLVLSWFLSLYPLDWLGLSSGVWQYLVIVLYYLPTTFVLSLSLATFAYLCKKFLDTSKQSFLIIPFVWLISEYFGALFFSIFTLGAASSLNFNFSYGFSGYLLANHDLLQQLAEFGGVALLTLGAAYGGALLWRLPKECAAILLLALILTGNRYERPYQAVGERVAIIETGFGTDLDWDDDKFKEESLNAAKVALLTEAETIALPESFGLTAYLGGEEETLAFINKHRTDDVVVVDTTRTALGGKKVLRSYIYNTKNQEVSYQDKQYLVPQGEYVPFIYYGFVNLLGKNTVLRENLSEIEYRKGVYDKESDPPILFCFSEANPNSLKKSRGGFVVHPVSHAWFHNPKTLWNQTDAMVTIQAIKSQVAIVRAGNEARSQVYLPNGEILSGEVVGEGDGWKVFQVDI